MSVCVVLFFLVSGDASSKWMLSFLPAPCLAAVANWDLIGPFVWPVFLCLLCVWPAKEEISGHS